MMLSIMFLWSLKNIMDVFKQWLGLDSQHDHSSSNIERICIYRYYITIRIDQNDNVVTEKLLSKKNILNSMNDSKLYTLLNFFPLFFLKGLIYGGMLSSLFLTNKLNK
jgi:hypothetical protein